MFKIKKCIALAMATTAVIGTSGFTVFADEEDDEMLGGSVERAVAIVAGVVTIAANWDQGVAKIQEVAHDVGQAVSNAAKATGNFIKETNESMVNYPVSYYPGSVD